VSEKTGNKYDQCVVTLPFVTGPGRPPLMHVDGRTLNGFNCSIIFAYAYKTGITGLSTKPHVHNYDEAVFFIGGDPEHFDELGAEVEMAIGEEQEIHVFDKPTAIVVPKGLPHCPIVTRKLEKPYLCMAVSLTGKRTD
jgi:hypothetical protein